MKAIMAHVGGRVPLGQIRSRLVQDLTGLAKLAVLPFQSFQPGSHVGGQRRFARSCSAFFTRSFSVRAVQPVPVATDTTVVDRDSCSGPVIQHQPKRSLTHLRRNLFDVLLAIAPPSQVWEPPANPALFEQTPLAGERGQMAILLNRC
jgi:hypothetical protein